MGPMGASHHCWGLLEQGQVRHTYPQVIIKLDSMDIVTVLSSSVHSFHLDYHILMECINMIRDLCIVRVCYVPREGNRCADILARIGYDVSPQTHDLVSPLSEVYKTLLSDIKGMTSF
ncbi:Ribonuclease H domain [Dillenia turbinata]|uniref:Ribonuclease H domain n=1 Tax=Dillenia turbinata TaxID=194707 RepID=A0AAN8V467_9MAGN